MWGVAVAEGTNPYNHNNLLRIAEPLDVDASVRDQLYGLYPPISLLMFAPLGWLPYKAALVAWNLVQLAALGACLSLLWRLFASSTAPGSKAMIAALVMVYWGTGATFGFSQSNFLVLLSLLLFWRDREHHLAGVWLALGCIVKPLVVLAAIYLLARGRWHTLATMLVTLLWIGLAAATAFGPRIYKQFFDRDKMPDSLLFTEDVNQSLSGVLLRLGQWEVPNGNLLEVPGVVLALLAVVGVAIWLLFRARASDGDYSLGLAVTTMLVVYPATLNHYGVHLLPAMALLLVDNDRPRRPRGMVVGVLLVALAFSALKATFVAIAVVWLAMAVGTWSEGRLDTAATPA